MANHRYYEVTRQDPALIQPGVHFSEIMRLTLDRRTYDADFDREAYVEQITKEFWDPTGNPVDAQPYPDVWLRMVRRRTADGGVITVDRTRTRMHSSQSCATRMTSSARK